jgi:hypothetical protein
MCVRRCAATRNISHPSPVHTRMIRGPVRLFRETGNDDDEAFEGSEADKGLVWTDIQMSAGCMAISMLLVHCACLRGRN